ncbi:MAG: SUMF1/EgtB/PvdO family nonheme iron enzyme [Nitrospinae bacterium]|nr:SUMF1/EgtB/PvdO family nonheme iron enzyme [Nitrospinota bacterium]
MSLIWKNDPAYPINDVFLMRPLDIRPGISNKYLEANATGNGVVVKADTILSLISGSTRKAYLFATDTEVTTLDTGVLTLGINYYIYLCDNGTDNGLLLISANSTAPSGYTTTNSRRIGGFHYGRKRNSITVADVTSGVVVPNSVWDLCHKPRCSPEGMVYLGNGVWVDIYLSSVDEAITFAAGSGSPILTGTAKSIYNAIPLTGTEGLSGYNFIEMARRSGKRLPTHAEWLQIAHGSPQGNNGDNVNAWSATTNTGRQNTGYVANAISLLNVVDCVGNVWEWIDCFIIRPDGTVGWNYYDVMPGMNAGQLYMYSNIELVMLLAGGDWSSGVIAGSRCVNLYYYPWNVNTTIGARFACDSL